MAPPTQTPSTQHVQLAMTPADHGAAPLATDAAAAPHAHFDSPGRRVASLDDAVTTLQRTTLTRGCTSPRWSSLTLLPFATYTWSMWRW
jgi:hypothetical protein